MVPSVGWSLAIEADEREQHPWGNDWENEFVSNHVELNKADCKENVKLKFKITGLNGLADFVCVYSGEDCAQETKSDCQKVLEAEPNSPQTLGHSWEVKVQDIHPDFKTCDKDRTVNLWVASQDDCAIKTGMALSQSIVVVMDAAAPQSPSGIKVVPGENKLTVKWESLDAADDEEAEDSDTGSTSTDSTSSSTSSTIADVEGYYIIFSKDSGSTTGGPVDTDSGNGTDDAGAGDAGVDGGADGGAGNSSGMLGGFGPLAGEPGSDLALVVEPAEDPDGTSPIRIRLYGATSDTTACSANGFKKGDDFDPEGGYKVEKITGRDRSSGTISGLSNGSTYRIAVVSYDTYVNVSKISDVLCAVPAKTWGFDDELGKAGGKAGEFCFVATAAFGSYDHPTVKALRMFRDRFLAHLPGGASLIDAYYRHGPALAKFVEGSENGKAMVRGGLTMVALGTMPLSFLGVLPAFGLSLMLVLGACWFGWIRRRRK